MLREQVLAVLRPVRKWRDEKSTTKSLAFAVPVGYAVRLVKTILVASLLFGSLVSGFSQTQEGTLSERINRNADRTLGNPLQNKSFSGTSSAPLKNSPAASQAFFGVKDATVKEFSTRSFLGLKNPWFGDRVFATKNAASPWKYDVKNAGFNKTTDVAAYYGATKNAALGSPVVPVSPYVPAPAAPGAVSRISDKITKKMTIDDIRELLNKPR